MSDRLKYLSIERGPLAQALQAHAGTQAFLIDGRVLDGAEIVSVEVTDRYLIVLVRHESFPEISEGGGGIPIVNAVPVQMGEAK